MKYRMAADANSLETRRSGFKWLGLKKLQIFSLISSGSASMAMCCCCSIAGGARARDVKWKAGRRQTITVCICVSDV